MKTYVDANALICVMHVASSQALGCSRSLTFDAKARKLAQLVGMQTD